MRNYERIIGDTKILVDCGELLYRYFFPAPAKIKPWKTLSTEEKAEFTNAAYQVQSLVVSRIIELDKEGGEENGNGACICNRPIQG